MLAKSPMLGSHTCGHCEQLVCNDTLTWNLKFENMRFVHETLKQVTCASKSIDLPLCINDPHIFVPIVKKFKMD